MSSEAIVPPKSFLRESLYNQPNSSSFRDILNGGKSFYSQPDYLKDTKRDFAQTMPLSVNYTWNTEHKIIRIVKKIFSIIIFPIGIYKLLHFLVAKVFLLPASSPINYPENHANNSRLNISLEAEWKYKRMTIEVDGYKVDAMIMGKASTLNNERWLLASNGNAEFYESKLSCSHDFKNFLNAVNGNAIVFNYPGVGVSSGLPSRQAMAKAYLAILNFLEDQKNGVGAKEIIGYGHSIGGGAQGDALKTHELKKDIKYVFVKSRTFSDLSTTVSILTSKPFGFLVKMLGWNMDPAESSKKLQAPEIIMQTANVKGYEEIKDSSKIIDDGIIPANASLAKVLLECGNFLNKNKLFIGMIEGHNVALNNPLFLAQKIEALLKI
jgi:hypothetical protein